MIDIRVPRGEILWVRYLVPSGEPAFAVTSKPSRDWYYLYEVLHDGTLKKLGKAQTPPELEEKYQVHQKMSELGSKT